MTTAQDLKELCDELDAALTGWIRPSYSLMTTETGKTAEQLVKRLRDKHYRTAMDKIVLECKLSNALEEVEGVRNQNAILTEELDKYERINS